MGIDVYLAWKGQTESEKEAQYTGYSVVHGHVGYLREAYHGGPYATAVLITEDWDEQPEGGFPIAAADLKARLPAAVMAALYREHVVYGDGLDPSTFNFGEGEGKSLLDAVRGALVEAKNAQHTRDGLPEPNDEQARAVRQLIASRKLPDFALAYVDFVDLAEKKEKETGEPARVRVSA